MRHELLETSPPGLDGFFFKLTPRITSSKYRQQKEQRQIRQFRTSEPTGDMWRRFLSHLQSIVSGGARLPETSTDGGDEDEDEDEPAHTCGPSQVTCTVVTKLPR